ncbi:hypothetical protein SBRCBS47491_006599 [Sporothrix bragantina]|uniref:Zn(2)-C6 fungal-type domain-containing protein n=1 Tax=Sporothrix bragantina TaxID=671064 RepID=A0ABP0C8R1_9PEZI
MTPPQLSASPPATRPSPVRRSTPDVSGVSDLGTANRPIRHRSRTGCLTCRTRKVKCDETQPLCQNCKRCALECTWPVVEDVLSSRVRRRLQQQQRRQQQVAQERERQLQQRVYEEPEQEQVHDDEADHDLATPRREEVAKTPTSTTTPNHSLHSDAGDHGNVESVRPGSSLRTPRAAMSATPVAMSYTACDNCRVGRCPCSMERPRCARCRQLHVACQYATSSTPAKDVEDQVNKEDNATLPTNATEASPPTNRPPGGALSNVPKLVLIQHIDAFFRYVYPCQANGFLHRGTLLRQFHAGTINRKVLLAVCAVSSRFVAVNSGDPPSATMTTGDVTAAKKARKAAIKAAVAQADAWAKEAKTLLILEDMTLETVVTALLLARHDIHNGLFGSAWMLSSMATRAALALGLNREQHIPQQKAISFTELETRRRLFWACYCLDRMMSTGLSDLTTLRAEHISLQLPCEEHHYIYGTPCWTAMPSVEWAREFAKRGCEVAEEDCSESEEEANQHGRGERGKRGQECEPNAPQLYDPSHGERDVGLFGHYVQIMEIRYCILHYVRNRFKSKDAHRAHQQQNGLHHKHPFQRHPSKPSDRPPPPPPPWSPSSWFARCKRKLTRWKRTLPPQLQLVPDTIYIRQAQDQLTALVMLHVWYDQCMSDLYRITMPGFPETLPDDQLLQAPPGWVQKQQEACVYHSTNIVTTLQSVAAMVGGDATSSDNSEPEKDFIFLDASLPMCVFDSIRVQLQWLFMQAPTADPAVAEARRSQCKENCETLMGFVEGMTKYFRQAQWLLEEMRHMLHRHHLPIRHTTILHSTGSPSSDAGGHPWQRRIQQLQDDDMVNGTGGGPRIALPIQNYGSLHTVVNMAMHSGLVTTTTTLAPDNMTASAAVGPAIPSSLGLPPPYHQSQQNQQNQQMLYSFPGTSTMGGSNAHGELYDESMNTMQMPLFGWDELQVLPDLAGFMGNNGDWLANGVLHDGDGSMPMVGVERQ